MRVAVGKGVEEGSSVAVDLEPIRARVTSRVGCGVPIDAGSGSAFRQPDRRVRKRTTPTITMRFTL